MKKTLFIITLCLSFMLIHVGCGSEQITLNLSYGDRTGKYTGELNDGVPNGQGKFTTTNDDGDAWTYEGEFKNGHFEGEGKTTWESGYFEVGTYENDVIVPISDNETKALFTSPENYKGKCVELTGKVFTTPEYTDSLVAIQMWSDIENSSNNTIVYIYDSSFEVKQDDYVKIVGIVGDVYEGTNAFGAVLTVPTIDARTYEVVGYIDAVSPTIKTVEVNQTQEQYGYSVTLQKVEFAENETRVYMKVVNNGSAKFNLYSFNTKLTQDGTQYSKQDNWTANYPDIQTELIVGNTTEGIIAFPPIEQKSFTVISDAYSENYREDLEPYQFNVDIQ